MYFFYGHLPDVKDVTPADKYKSSEIIIKSVKTIMHRGLIVFMVIIFASCKRQSHCENATVYKSQLCGIDWEVEFEGKRYPVQNLPDDLKRDKNRIGIISYHLYTDSRLCACCGYTYLVVDTAADELICL